MSKTAEKLNCMRNEMTHLWGSVFLIAGGSVSALFTFSTRGYVIGAVGIILALALLNAYFIRREETLRIVNSMEEE